MATWEFPIMLLTQSLSMLSNNFMNKTMKKLYNSKIQAVGISAWPVRQHIFLRARASPYRVN